MNIGKERLNRASSQHDEGEDDGIAVLHSALHAAPRWFACRFLFGLLPQIAYSELDEGKVYLGVITDVWLYHGVQVDIGAEFDV